MSTAVATQQPSQSLGSPRQQDRKALVSSDGKNGKILCIIHRILTWTYYAASQICNFNDNANDACILKLRLSFMCL